MRTRPGPFGLAALLLVLVAQGLGALERPELRAQSLRFALRGPRASGAKVVLVALDDDCLAAWPEPLAFWGGHEAAVLDAARRAGARWVGLDLILPGIADDYLERIGGEKALERAGEPDGRLARALQEAAGRVGLATKNEPDGAVVGPSDRFTLVDDRVAADQGFVELPVALDESVREAPLYRRQSAAGPDAAKAGFAAVAAARARGLDPGSRNALDRLAPRLRSRDGLFLIDDLGRPVPRLSALRLAQGRLSPAERRLLDGAFVVVGVAYRGAGDVVRGPDGREMPGAEMHLNALATLLDGRAVARLRPGQEALATLVLGALALALARRRGAAALVPLAMAAYALAAQAAFVRGGLFLPMVGPLAALALPPLVRGAARAVEERAARARVERVFGAQVGRRLRDHMLGPGGREEQGGAQMEAAVLFVDLRGSSAMARLQPPPETIATLNAFFDAVVPPIEARGGIVYAFLGDGLLAAFGAPIPQEGHAAAALAAAREAVAAVDALNLARAEKGLAPLRMGCGVHAGPLVCGNLGARDRLQLTVVGDTVNTAARLEAACKPLGARVVASARVLAQAPGESGWRGPVRIEPAGTGPIDVWSLP